MSEETPIIDAPTGSAKKTAAGNDAHKPALSIRAGRKSKGNGQGRGTPPEKTAPSAIGKANGSPPLPQAENGRTTAESPILEGAGERNGPVKARKKRPARKFSLGIGKPVATETTVPQPVVPPTPVVRKKPPLKRPVRKVPIKRTAAATTAKGHVSKPGLMAERVPRQPATGTATEGKPAAAAGKKPVKMLMKLGKKPRKATAGMPADLVEPLAGVKKPTPPAIPEVDKKPELSKKPLADGAEPVKKTPAAVERAIQAPKPPDEPPPAAAKKPDPQPEPMVKKTPGVTEKPAPQPKTTAKMAPGSPEKPAPLPEPVAQKAVKAPEKPVPQPEPVVKKAPGVPEKPVVKKARGVPEKPAPQPPPVTGKEGQKFGKAPIAPAPPEKKPEVGKKITGPESLQNLLKPETEILETLKQGKKQNRYLAQSVVLEESGLSDLVRMSMFLVSLVVIFFFTWAWFSTIDEMAATSGEVIPSSPVQKIQHLEGGIIHKLHVSKGQVVNKNQLLATLAPEAVVSELNQMRAARATLLAQQARLQALLEDRPPDFSAIAGEYVQFQAGQSKLLEAQRAAWESQRRVLLVQASRSRVEIDNLKDQQRAINRRLRLLLDKWTVTRNGYDKGLSSRLEVMTARQAVSDAESELLRLTGRLQTVGKTLAETTEELERANRDRLELAQNELEGVVAELARVEQGVARLEDRRKRLKIYSPVRGVVKELFIETIQGVIPAGAVIAEIVPIDKTRFVETRISPRDIGHVEVGQKVTVKVTTFDFARYGGIEGSLHAVSPSTFEDPGGGEPFYKGLIRLNKNHIGSDPAKNEILPGMTVQADIHTGAKTVMEYMLKPIYASVNKAFRER